MKDNVQTSPEQLRYALEAFGIKHIDGKPIDAHPHAFGVGVLLAVAELAAQDLDRADLAVASDGWAAAVVAAGGGDAEQTMRGWATLVNQRLNRTALELHEAVTGEGQVFTDVAGPAMLIAANVMAVCNSDVDQDRARDLVDHLGRNIKALRQNFSALCAFLRSRGLRV